MSNAIFIKSSELRFKHLSEELDKNGLLETFSKLYALQQRSHNLIFFIKKKPRIIHYKKYIGYSGYNWMILDIRCMTFKQLIYSFKSIV